MTTEIPELPKTRQSLSTLTYSLKNIPENVRDRHKHLGIEEMTLRVRRQLEYLVEQLVPHTTEQATLHAMYGTRLFRCLRLDCNMSLKAFSTRVIRDQHVDEHGRPFLCVQKGCPISSLGFATEYQLKRHCKNSHNMLENDEIHFPQARTKKHADTLCKAAARGDDTTIRMLIEQGADVNQASKPKGSLTPLILAAQGSHLQSCQILLEAGSHINY